MPPDVDPFKTAVLWVTMALIGGCVQHELVAPQLDPIVAAAKTMMAPQPKPGQNLKQLPQKVRVLCDGEECEYLDEGGLQLLQGYGDCRSAYRAAAGTAR